MWSGCGFMRFLCSFTNVWNSFWPSSKWEVPSHPRWKWPNDPCLPEQLSKMVSGSRVTELQPRCDSTSHREQSGPAQLLFPEACSLVVQPESRWHHLTTIYNLFVPFTPNLIWLICHFRWFVFLFNSSRVDICSQQFQLTHLKLQSCFCIIRDIVPSATEWTTTINMVTY